MDDVLQGISDKDLFRGMPTSLVKQIDELNDRKISWDVIGTLLAATPTHGIVLKGGSPWTGNLWQGVKSEVHDFICTQSSAYADLRKEWEGYRKQGAPVLVAALAGVIGGKLGVASGVLAPLVIWALVTIARIGKEAFCKSFVTNPPSPPSA